MPGTWTRESARGLGFRAVCCAANLQGLSGVQDGQGAKDYTSDSGVSEGGAMPSPAPKREKRRSKGARGDLLGSSAMHVESRPSMLSADRIALTQHSGASRLPVPGPGRKFFLSYGVTCSYIGLPPLRSSHLVRSRVGLCCDTWMCMHRVRMQPALWAQRAQWLRVVLCGVCLVEVIGTECSEGKLGDSGCISCHAVLRDLTFNAAETNMSPSA